MDDEFGPEQTVTDALAGAQEVARWRGVITELCSQGSHLISKYVSL